eukprot:319689-Amphidinium_carterae.2
MHIACDPIPKHKSNHVHPKPLQNRKFGYIAGLSTGPIPASLEAPAVLLSHNLLQGSIPQHLLEGQDRLEKWVTASTSVSRL